jgi:MYXO-CTERM domain-containing protein
MSDNLHFTITDGSGPAIVTLIAHLDSTIGSEAGSNTNNYNMSDQFILGGSACWGSATGLGFQPCGSQNDGFLTSSFTNQSATGFDFTGTFQLTNGATDPVFAALNVDCSGGANCDFSNTAAFSLSLPSDVTFTSDSGVLFSQTGAAATPEPGSFGMAAAALLGVVVRRRRRAKNRR